MAFRVLVDENTSPDVVDALGERDLDAVHVIEALEAGVGDERIVDYASDRGMVVLTHDDFLHSSLRGRVPILFYSDDSLDSTSLADRVDRVVQYVPDPDDLPPVTNLGTWQ